MDDTAEATQVAIITGGTSGIGLAVTTGLAQRPNWHVYILGKTADRGLQATKKLGYSNVVYRQCDVSKYQDLAGVFQSIYRTHGRIDHVFANAGVTDVDAIMAKKEQQQQQEQDGDSGIPPPPPEPKMDLVDINFTAVMYTSYLAAHYFRLSPGAGKGASLVINGSVASLHPTSVMISVYAATKHGVLGFMRSIARDLWKEGIRVNVLCLGPTSTGILPEEVMTELFRPEHLCPMDMVVKTTLALMDGSEIVDNDGGCVSGDDVHGLAVEVLGPAVYVKPQLECDNELVRSVLFLDS